MHSSPSSPSPNPNPNSDPKSDPNFDPNARLALARARPDPAAELLLEREISALRTLTAVRLLMIALLVPMVWWLSFSPFDRIATTSLLITYVLIVAASARLIGHRRRLTAVGLIGVALDVGVIAALPMIWYASLGGGELPFGITLKTSVSLIALLLMTLNALAMRPLYPALVTVGAVIVHLVLVGLSLGDENTVFTSSYLIAYTTDEIGTARVIIRISVIVLVGLMLTLITMGARRMVVEAVQLQKANVQLGRYFSPNLVPKLVDSPELFRVGGERRELSFVFTDLAGFTRLVESNDPSVVVPVINGYLDGPWRRD